jgi:hypothetical protein
MQYYIAAHIFPWRTADFVTKVDRAPSSAQPIGCAPRERTRVIGVTGRQHEKFVTESGQEEGGAFATKPILP